MFLKYISLLFKKKLIILALLICNNNLLLSAASQKTVATKNNVKNAVTLKPKTVALKPKAVAKKPSGIVPKLTVKPDKGVEKIIAAKKSPEVTQNLAKQIEASCIKLKSKIDICGKQKVVSNDCKQAKESVKFCDTKAVSNSPQGQIVTSSSSSSSSDSSGSSTMDNLNLMMTVVGFVFTVVGTVSGFIFYKMSKNAEAKKAAEDLKKAEDAQKEADLEQSKVDSLTKELEQIKTKLEKDPNNSKLKERESSATKDINEAQLSANKASVNSAKEALNFNKSKTELLNIANPNIVKESLPSINLPAENVPIEKPIIKNTSSLPVQPVQDVPSKPIIPTCNSGQVLINGICCQPDQVSNGKTCTTCPNIQIPNNAKTACECPTNTNLTNGLCCQPGQISDGKTCMSCKPNLVPNKSGTACEAQQPILGPTTNIAPTKPTEIGIFTTMTGNDYPEKTQEDITIYTFAVAPGYNYNTKTFPSKDSGWRCSTYLPQNENRNTPFVLKKYDYLWKIAYMCPAVDNNTYAKYNSGVLVYGIGPKIYTSKVFMFENNKEISISLTKDKGIKILSGSSENSYSGSGKLALCSTDGISKGTTCGCTNYPDSSIPYTQTGCNEYDWISPKLVQSSASGGTGDVEVGFQNSQMLNSEIPVAPEDNEEQTTI